MLRSKEMTAVQLIERNDAARAIVTELGVLGVVEFRDMNAGVPFYKRAFSDEVRRCEAMSRRLDNLLRMLRDNRLKPWDRDTDAALAPIADADSNVRQMDADLMQMRQQEVLAMNSHNALKEHLLVLTAGATVHGSALRGGAPTSLAPSTSTGAMEEGGVQLGPLPPPAVTGTTNVGSQQNPNILQFVVGTIPRAVALKFARAVHRVSRGNCMTHEFPLEERLLDGDPKNPRPIAKNFFMIFYSGSVLHSKLQKLCLHFGASTFPYPGALNERQSIEMRLRQEIGNFEEVLRTARQHRRQILLSAAQQWSYWRHICSRETATLHTLNLLNFDIRRKVFVAEGWVPTEALASVRSALRTAALKAGGETESILNILVASETPPTCLPSSKFTDGFQALVNTYGVPRYREINPGAFAIVLFPFLFAIMFGDLGHGFVLLLVAAYFIRNEAALGKQELDDIIGMMYGGRYVMLLNALFAMYVGVIYNEAFALPLGLFRSAYAVQPASHGNGTEVVWDGTVYPFGVDSAWHLAENKMAFFNSFKMKVSIVVGVAQMTLGIVLSLLNHLEFEDRKSVIWQFIPEMVFFMSVFGYLVLMIFLKWATDWVAIGAEPPSLLNTLIAMFMSPGTYTEKARLYPGQEYLQLFLVLCAVIAVPCLLLPKPILLLLEHKAKTRAGATAGYATLPLATAGEEEEDDDDSDEFDFSEVLVHQVIHTIEFVLGGVSNTASYLRLWALSLAHSQLSELFWEKIMQENAFPAASLPVPFNGIVMVLMFGIWLCLNLGIIMVMENLSSFLHALRLQWVEFQNKFFSGDGRQFAPFEL